MNADRFFALLLALQSRETTTTADLAAYLGVSVRTVLRDLQWLQEAGFPLLIRRGRWGGVTLLPGGSLDTSRLTAEERDHLALYGLDDVQRAQLGAAAGTRRARQKMHSALRPPNIDVLPLSAVVTTDNRSWYSRDAEGLPPVALVGDLRRGVRLRIRYRRSAESEPTDLDAGQLTRARRILGRRLTIRGPAGARQVSITVTGRDVEDVRMLLPFGNGITVTGPAEAREHIRRIAEQILQVYACAGAPLARSACKILQCSPEMAMVTSERDEAHGEHVFQL
ncbi:hypothetical protein Aph02nite_23860 [Actinoplanes philippinensis]|uniref:HTH domain-containing protein n=1 Tax=Actinoplanes philippinensis TaxID=35752 RepID=A0A1I2FZL2_9ACTN|nr:HTH domain-containing protein [Actinoplanes philippinensis]GIE76436.1 hypothetical protein Aph02nite_23860 [Actinoplanes philippinensis]SFF10258.1 HTH domain-containing protein [Actinoplanes philippinensis]